MGQLYDQPFAGKDANAFDFPPSSVYRDLGTSHEAPPFNLPNVSGHTQPQTSSSVTVVNQSGVQYLLLAPELPQNPEQSDLRIIPHRPSSNPTQRILTDSSFQQESPSQNKTTGIATRKRLRSPNSVEAQQRQNFRQQLSKNKNIPGYCLDVFCISSVPAPKRPRTGTQKKNKNDVMTRGGSCFLCRMNKKQVMSLVVSAKLLLVGVNFLGSVLANVPATLVKSCTKRPTKDTERNPANQRASCSRVMLRQSWPSSRYLSFPWMRLFWKEE